MLKFSSLQMMLRKMRHRREMRWWAQAADQAVHSDLARLRRRSVRAREMRGALNAFLHIAENRLALPRIGSDAFFKPIDADWSWRPEAFRGPLAQVGYVNVVNNTRIGGELSVFHDCSKTELTVRQLRNTHQNDLAPYGLRMDVFKFDGSFLSLVLDLPPEAVRDLRRSHLMRMDMIIESEHPIEIFARLNLKHGPNSENVVREIPAGVREAMIEFDLGYLDFNENRAEKIWIDLIFEGAEMNQVTLRDLTFNRTPRAEM